MMGKHAHEDELEVVLREGAAEDERSRQAAIAATSRLRARIVAGGLADVSYTQVDSPLGPLLAASTKRGLVRLAYPEHDPNVELERLARELSPRILEAAAPLEQVRRELDEYFSGTRHTFELAQDWTLIGPFARRILSVTCEIPYGQVLTYGRVATDAGSPRGSRAAGNALGSNPIPIVIPCHRVLRSGGALGGYAGGAQRKQWLLELESRARG